MNVILLSLLLTLKGTCKMSQYDVLNQKMFEVIHSHNKTMHRMLSRSEQIFKGVLTLTYAFTH